MEVKELHGEGNHLIFDGDSQKNISDISFIEQFLSDLVNEIEMRPISKPMVMHHHAEPETEGITGTIFLAESNITIHTYPNKKWFALDIFSCKEFKLDRAKQFIIERLKVTDYSTKTIRRGFYNGTSEKHED